MGYFGSSHANASGSKLEHVLPYVPLTTLAVPPEFLEVGWEPLNLVKPVINQLSVACIEARFFWMKLIFQWEKVACFVRAYQPTCGAEQTTTGIPKYNTRA